MDLKTSALKLWPPHVQPHAFRRELAMLLSEDPDFRLRVCHLESLLQARTQSVQISAQLQMTLTDPSCAKYFAVNWCGNCDWAWRVVHLNVRELLADAQTAGTVSFPQSPLRPPRQSGHSHPQPSPWTKVSSVAGPGANIPRRDDQLVVAIYSQWPNHSTDDDEYLAMMVAFVLIFKEDQKCQLPKYSLHLTDVGGYLRAFSTADSRLAEIYPRTAKRGMVLKRPRLSEFVLQPKFNPFFTVRDSTLRKSEKVVTLVVDKLLEVTPLEGSMLINNGLIRTSPEETWEEEDPLAPLLLPTFLFDYELVADQGGSITDMSDNDSQGGLIKDDILNSGSCLATSPTGSEDEHLEVLHSMKEGSDLRSQPGAQLDDGKVDKPEWEASTQQSNSEPSTYDIFTGSDALFSSSLVGVPRPEVPQQIASCWNLSGSGAPTSCSHLDVSCIGQLTGQHGLPLLDTTTPTDVLSNLGLFSTKGSSATNAAAAARLAKNLGHTLWCRAGSMDSSEGSHGSARLHQDILLDMDVPNRLGSPEQLPLGYSLEGMPSPDLNAVYRVTGSLPDGFQLISPVEEDGSATVTKLCSSLGSAFGAKRSTWSAIAAKDPKLPLAPGATFLKHPSILSGSSLHHCPRSAPMSRSSSANGLTKIENPRLQRLPPRVREELLRMVDQLHGLVKLEDFDDGVLHQLSIKKSEEEACGAVRAVATYDLANIQHMAAYLNHVIKHYNPAGEHGGAVVGASAGMIRLASTPISCKAILQKLPLRVYKRLEEVVNSCTYLEWKHFDAGVIKVLSQLAKIAPEDVFEELEVLENTDLSNVEYMPAYLNKRLNNRLWSRRKGDH